MAHDLTELNGWENPVGWSCWVVLPGGPAGWLSNQSFTLVDPNFIRLGCALLYFGKP